MTLKPRVFSILFSVFLIAVGSNVLAQYLKFEEIETKWDTYSQTVDAKTELLSQFKSEVGFGGAIHSFKNFLLRGNVDDYNSAASMLLNAMDLLAEYEILDGSDDRENVQIAVIAESLQSYRRSLNHFKAVRPTEPIENIDNAVRVDDSSTLNAIQWLTSYNHEKKENLRVDFDRTLESSVEILFSSALLSVLFITLFLYLVKSRISLANSVQARQETLLRESLREQETINRLLRISSASGFALDRKLNSALEIYGHGEKFGLDEFALIAVKAEGKENEFHMAATLNFSMEEEDEDRRALLSLLDARDGIIKDGSSVEGYKSVKLMIGHEQIGLFVVPVSRYKESAGGSHSFVFAAAKVLSRIIADHKYEEALIKAKEEAEAAGRSKAAFLANMSHEIRTPMNGVLGMAQLLDDTHLSMQQKSHVRTIQSCGDSLLAIINDILDFSKIEVAKLEIESIPFCCSRVIDEVLELLSPGAEEKGIYCRYNPSQETKDQWFFGDKVRFRQVVTNLLSNAIKFTKSGGVTITSEVATNRNGELELLFSVEDTGVGIEAEMIPHLFQPFSQADASTTRRFGGTGLGLSICKGITEKMGGKLWLESELGVGSQFNFTISARKAKQPKTDASETLELSDSRLLAEQVPLRILVAEDNRVNQKVVRGQLKRLGYHSDDIIIVENGKLAVEAAIQGQFDLVLMDCHMPVMDGFEATREIQQRIKPSSCPAIFALSASSMSEEVKACFDAGMNDFISKPLTSKTLTEALKNGLERGLFKRHSKLENIA